MSLIKCPECGKEISDKAVTCPQCGYPIGNEANSTSINKEEPIMAVQSFPDLPTVINVGKQVVNWAMDAAAECFYDRECNTVKYLNSGKGHIYVHSNGICIFIEYSEFFISFDQIIDMRYTSYEKIISERKSKSVIGRAALGGVLLGPVGAVVGGMSGLGTTKIANKKINAEAIAIEFWDVYTHTRQIIAIEVPLINEGNRLINRVMSDKQSIKDDSAKGNNYICNILDNNGQIEDSKALEALKIVGEQTLTKEIQKINNCGFGEAGSIIKRIGQKNNIDTSMYQSAGCLSSIFLIASSIVGLCSVFCMILNLL